MKAIILMLQGKELGADGESDDVTDGHVLTLEQRTYVKVTGADLIEQRDAAVALTLVVRDL
jgi:hypothetical protein